MLLPKILMPLSWRMNRYGQKFEQCFPGEFSLDPGTTIDVEGKKTPAIRIGSTVLNLNFAIPDQFTSQTGVGGTIFVRSGDDFIRVTTSVKKNDGTRAVGAVLDRSHPAYRPLLSGDSYCGFASLYGKQFMTRYDPIRDRSGQVIGVLGLAWDVENEPRMCIAGKTACTTAGLYGAAFYGFYTCMTLLGPTMPAALRLPLAAFGIGSTLMIALIIYFLVRRNVMAPLVLGKLASQKIAAGDLSTQIHVDRRCEIGQILQAVNGISVGLAGVVGNVRSATDGLHHASTEISAGNADLSARTESQVSSLQQTASAMEQLTATVLQNADHAAQANTLVASASSKAAEGGLVVQQAVNTMHAIKDSARRIEDIIGLIDGIAFQTNILALNAAVEAARAGEQGRGFAVVASEVRNLAQRSAGSAKEIKQLIVESVNTIDAGARYVEGARTSIEDIMTSVKSVVELMQDISAASEAQSNGITSVNREIAQMDETTQQNAALVGQAAATSMSMREQADMLSRTVGVFKLAA